MISLGARLKSTEAILTTPKVAEAIRSLTTESRIKLMPFSVLGVAVYTSDKMPEGEVLMGSRQQVLAKLREYEGVAAEVQP